MAETPSPIRTADGPPRWADPDYGRVVLACAHGADLVLAFADGDVAQIPLQLCYPEPEVLDPGTFTIAPDGGAVSVEDEHGARITTGWSVFRSRSDAAYAQHVAARAAEERRVIGLRVEALRLRADIDRAGLARQARLPEVRVAAIEAGQPVPDLMAALARILALLGRGWGDLAGIGRWRRPGA